MRDIIERIKEKNPLLDVCRDYGLEPQKVGRLYRCICPFHEESDPSFTIYPEDNRFFCFGQGCEAHGDVITFVMEKENLSFLQAIRKLSERAGVSLRDNFDEDFYRKHETILSILEDASNFYHAQLISPRTSGDKIAQAYLENRCIEKISWSKFKIGYASVQNEVVKHLLDQSYKNESIIKSGIVKKAASGEMYPFFRNRIIFPFLKNGRSFYLTGRALDNSDEPRYLNLRINDFVKKGIYNLQSLNPGSDEIHITEGPIDCILAEQAGFPTIALCGSKLKEYQIKGIKNKKVYLAFDNDQNRAGQDKAIKLAEELLQYGIESKIIDLPRSKRKTKVDLADYLNSEGSEALEELKESSLTLIDHMIRSLSSRAKGEQIKGVKSEVFPLLFMLEETELALWLEKIKENLGLKTDIYQALKREFKTAKNKFFKEKHSTWTKQNKPYEMSLEEKKEALEYLKHPNLIQNIQNDFVSIGIVGERINALSLYLFSLTRKTNTPISAILFGDSSSGKSYLLNTISSLVPEEDVMIISSATPRSFEYGSEDQLKHKFIIIQEIEGMLDVEPIIRLMQSEGKLARYSPIKKYDGGQFESEYREIECPASIITTTTRDRVHQENSTRIFELYLDQSQEQTKRIQQLEKKKASIEWKKGENERTKAKRFHKNIQRVLNPFDVNIPYANHIDFPIDSTRNRRDFPRFLRLIEVIALLRQYQKEQKKCDDDTNFIEADITDYKIAYDLGKKLLASTLSPVSDRAFDVLRVVLSLDLDKEEEFARSTVRKRAKEMKVQVSANNNTLGGQLGSLEEIGAIECTQGGPGKTYKYKRKINELSELDELVPDVISSPGDLEKRIQREEEGFDEIFEPGQANAA